jgi:hypothetical protein
MSSSLAPGEPGIRASLLKLYLEVVSAAAAEHAEAVHRALGPDAIARIVRARSADWLPMAWEVAILRAVHERSGDAGVRVLARALGRRAVEHPIFRTLFEVARVLLGVKPEAMLDVGNRGWTRATRDAGTSTLVRRGPGMGVVRFEGLPEPLRHRALFVKAGASGEVVLELVRDVAARSEVEYVDGSACAELRFSWERRPVLGGERRS